VAPPALDDDLGLAQSVEALAVEQLIAKAGVETLDPRRSPILFAHPSDEITQLATDLRPAPERHETSTMPVGVKQAG